MIESKVEFYASCHQAQESLLEHYTRRLVRCLDDFKDKASLKSERGEGNIPWRI